MKEMYENIMKISYINKESEITLDPKSDSINILVRDLIRFFPVTASHACDTIFEFSTQQNRNVWDSLHQPNLKCLRDSMYNIAAMIPFSIALIMELTSSSNA